MLITNSIRRWCRLSILQPRVYKRFLDWRLLIRLTSFSLLSFILRLLRWVHFFRLNILCLGLFDINFKVFKSLILRIHSLFLLLLPESQILTCNIILLVSGPIPGVFLIHELYLLLMHNLLSFSFLPFNQYITNLSSMVKINSVVFHESLNSISHVIDLW